MGMYGRVDNESRWAFAAFRDHPKVLSVPEGLSRTRQEFAAECDVNNIMAKYKKTGMLPSDGRQMQYVSFENVPDLMSAMNTMIEAEAAFMRLPATVRRDFDNSAVEFVKFAEDKANLPKLREWGLAAPEKAPDAPLKVEMVNPTVAPPAPTQ